MGPLNGLDESFGNKWRSTLISFVFMPLKFIILARGYRLPADGGELGIVLNMAWFIVLVLGPDVWEFLFFGLLMVLNLLLLFFLFVDLCCYRIVIGR